jgi:hypothetical protein
MAANWDAIVLGDYEAVMPMTWKRKWGIRYLYQPSFIQQGGIFFKESLSSETMKSFIDKASSQFNFAEITLNYLNKIDAPGDELKISLRNNFLLQLGSGYAALYKNYNPYIKQRLNRLNKFLLQYTSSANYTEAIALYKELYHSRLPGFSNDDFSHFESLCKFYSENGRMILRHVYKQGDDELLAAILLLKDEHRIYNIISCILPNGKKFLANYFLFDELIKEFSNENIILDFEGSDIPGIAYFYKKFSGDNQPYPFLKYNRLPSLVRILKP